MTLENDEQLAMLRRSGAAPIALSSSATANAAFLSTNDPTEVQPIALLAHGMIDKKFAESAAEAGEFPTIRKADGTLYGHPKDFHAWIVELFGSSLDKSGRIKKPVSL